MHPSCPGRRQCDLLAKRLTQRADDNSSYMNMPDQYVAPFPPSQSIGCTPQSAAAGLAPGLRGLLASHPLSAAAHARRLAAVTAPTATYSLAANYSNYCGQQKNKCQGISVSSLVFSDYDKFKACECGTIVFPVDSTSESMHVIYLERACSFGVVRPGFAIERAIQSQLVRPAD